jgi:hypothetical protein
MEKIDLELLETFDPMKLTIADLGKLNNSVLRQAVFAALQSAVNVTGADHTNHWAFSSHAKSIQIDSGDPEILGNITRPG